MRAGVIHGDTLEDLQRRDADVERAVLASAVAWHAEDRVVGQGNDTIVFPRAHERASLSAGQVGSAPGPNRSNATCGLFLLAELSSSLVAPFAGVDHSEHDLLARTGHSPRLAARTPRKHRDFRPAMSEASLYRKEVQ
jgi:hypothetical protein